MTEYQLAKELGERIKAIRIARDLTTEQMAALAQCGQSTVVGIENATTTPSLRRLYKIAAVFGIDPWQLLHPDWRKLCRVD